MRNLAFHDLTPPGTNIPRGLKALLGLSLKFCPTPPSVRPTVYTSALPDLFRSIRIGCQFPSDNRSNYNRLIYVKNTTFEPDPAPPYLEQLMAESLSHPSPKLPHSRNKHWNLNTKQRELLDQLSKQKQFKILQTDKNLGPAIMTTEQYWSFCLQHLRQADVYDPILTGFPEDNIFRLVHQYLTDLVHTFPCERRDARIIACERNCKPPYFHGVPKVHKSPMGCRPIVSNVNSFTTGLSKWLTVKLQPYAAAIHSFVRDSAHLQKEIIQLERREEDRLFTFDVTSMYTSIPVAAALTAVRWFLDNRRDPLADFIIRALKIVMENNYFTFGSTVWKQRQGLAMGTPVAPVVATLYLGYYEETRILQKCRDNLRFYKRYLDDILIVWSPSATNPYAFQRFQAVLRQVPGLAWTFEEHPEEANYLDLWIYKEKGTEVNNNNRYGTRTHQKQLNLYLYPTYTSAHPKGIHKGLIYGLLKKYREQNTNNKDYITIANLLYSRLLARGFTSATLRPLFLEAQSKLQNSKSNADTVVKTTRQYFLKIPYDPNGPTKAQLRCQLALEPISKELDRLQKSKITICYQRPKNLQAHLSRTRETDYNPLDSAL